MRQSFKIFFKVTHTTRVDTFKIILMGTFNNATIGLQIRPLSKGPANIFAKNHPIVEIFWRIPI